MKYRVTVTRWDDRPAHYEFFAKNDEEALEIYQTNYLNNKRYDWDFLQLSRIDVIEKTTLLHSRI